MPVGGSAMGWVNITYIDKPIMLPPCKSIKSWANKFNKGLNESSEAALPGHEL